MYMKKLLFKSYLSDTTLKLTGMVFITLFILCIDIILLQDIALELDPVYCIDESTEKKLSAATELAKNVSANVKDNNANINVKNPEFHIHNPNINVPSSLGASIGVGGTVSAGIYALTRSKKFAAAPIGAKAGYAVLGAAIGGFGYVTTNYANTRIQKNLDSSASNSMINRSNSKNGPLSAASSVIEEGDSVESIMYLFYINLLLSIVIIFLLVFLVYLYVNYKKQELSLYTVWFLLLISSLLSSYLAYIIVQDIDIISKIYQDSTTISVVNYDKLDPFVDEIKETTHALYSNLALSVCIFYSLLLLAALHINTKLINNKSALNFMKNMLGQRNYYYFIKMLTFTSKSNELWIYIGLTIILIASLFSIYFAYMWIIHIDLFTELYQSSIK